MKRKTTFRPYIAVLLIVALFTSLLPANFSFIGTSTAAAETSVEAANPDLDQMIQDRADTDELQTSIPEENLITISSVAKRFSVNSSWIAEEVAKGYDLHVIYQGLLQKQSGKDYEAYMKEQYPGREVTSQELQEKEAEKVKAYRKNHPAKSNKSKAQSSIAAQSSNSYDKVALERKALKYDQAPYSLGGQDGQISSVDGSLSISQTDLVLPGPNGFDFPLTRVYNSSAGKDDIYVRQLYVNNYINDIQDSYVDRYSALGKGWSWNLSRVVVDQPGSPFMQIAGLGTFKISRDSQSGMEGFPYNYYKLQQVYYSPPDINDTIIYQLSNYQDGTIQFFNTEGNLVEMRDQSGNKIRFSYSYINGYNDKHLQQVETSTADGRQYNTLYLSYTGNTSILASIGTKQVTYKKSKTSMNGKQKETLTEVVDPAGRSTRYTYGVSQMLPFNLIPEYRNYTGTNQYTYWGYQDWMYLSSIEHPTKAMTYYTTNMGYTDIGPGSVEMNIRYTERKNVYSSDGMKESRETKLELNGNYMGPYGYSSSSFTVPVVDGPYKTVYSYTRRHWNDRRPDSFYLMRTVTTPSDKTTPQLISTYTYNESLGNPEPTSSSISSLGKSGLITTQTTRQSFNQWGLVGSITDARGLTSTYQYEEIPLIHGGYLTAPIKTTVDVGNSDQVITTSIYGSDGYGHLLSSTSNNKAGKLLQKTNYTYDVNGNATQIVLKGESKDTIVQQEFGAYNGFQLTSQTVQTTKADGTRQTKTVRATYDFYNAQMTSFTDGNGSKTAYTYDGLGRPLTETYADGTQTKAVYEDTINQITITDPTGRKVQNHFTPFGQLDRETNARGSVNYHYDSYGNLRTKLDYNGSFDLYYFNKLGRLDEQIVRGARTEYAYDDANKTITTTDAVGNKIRTTYDALDQPTLIEELKSSGNVKIGTSAYDTAGNLTRSTDANGNATNYAYDTLGLLTAVTDALGQKTTYTYDLFGNNTLLTYADGKQMKYQYDETGRLMRQTDPLGQVETFEYDSADNLTGYTDRNGKKRLYFYNTRGFLISDNAVDGTISYVYDAAGRRTKMTDGTGTTGYEYTAVGELASTTYPDGSSLKMDYEVRGLRSAQTFNSGSFQLKLQQSYNVNTSTLSTMSAESGNGAKLGSYTYSYRQNNTLSDISSGSGLVQTYSYDGLNLAGMKQSDNGTIFGSYAYSYDNNRNIVSKTDNGETHTFGYDALNRLKASSLFNESYAYDPRGNRSEMTSEREPDFSEANYTYDARDRLTNVKTETGNVSYRYNGDGLMTERTGEDGKKTRYYYDDRSLLVAEGTVDAGGSVTITVGYVYDANGQIKARQIPGENELQTYWTNAHGDITEIKDAAGKTLNQYTYDVWGNPIIEEETTDNVLRYSGEYWDGETGLQYLRARWYDPNIGRFINEDTYEGEKAQPGTLNLYAYVQGNPLTHNDPSGHKQEMAPSGGGGGGGGIIGWTNTVPGIKKLEDALFKGFSLAATSYITNKAMRNKKNNNKVFFYHATAVDSVDSILDGINLEAGRKNVDFGQGFYVTRNPGQAERWVENKFDGEGAIIVFAIDKEAFNKYNGLFLKSVSETADFIYDSRRGMKHNYDFVSGRYLLNPLTKVSDGKGGKKPVPTPKTLYQLSGDQLSIHNPALAAEFLRGYVGVRYYD
ncbi:RHS repeat-associated core domain-containing protein [Saccharibacillus sp. CPCC 101409]|uniref:RHS repeat-associated core domain-containing protein n=1 Tax=Saccharibacillus sp. CPCC 101409 TaxID=3058041 RepID=UPI002671E126|nr:RHS repeat-associated core domain-containing protein [Saccharibacillus sp. CPCC 101409]MDO3411901.1 RHS repeat-associated core domain-containing protein [Saccharibacillus sp. CPCC 101409]